jgi:hypothetical protein
MTTWKAYLTFKNTIRNVTTKLKFTFSPIYNYDKLYRNLDDLLKTIGWKNTEYTTKNVAFKLTSYVKTPIYITDWKKYIIHKDKIQIIFFDPNKHYYALYDQKGEIVLKSETIDKIYQEINIDLVPEPLELYLVNDIDIKLKLIDIIDNPKRHYNQVVTRLVKKYNY